LVLAIKPIPAEIMKKKPKFLREIEILKYLPKGRCPHVVEMIFYEVKKKKIRSTFSSVRVLS
jgi:hypothetical protein